MVCPSCTHRETSASFAATGVKTQAKLAHVAGAARGTLTSWCCPTMYFGMYFGRVLGDGDVIWRSRRVKQRGTCDSTFHSS